LKPENALPFILYFFFFSFAVFLRKGLIALRDGGLPTSLQYPKLIGWCDRTI
jgi:hypothetical protein